MEHRKRPSAHGSFGTAEEYSVLSPNRSTVSGHTGIPPAYPTYNKTEEYDQNHPYFPNIAQDLLSGAGEWRNIQDIIKMTLKAIVDVVKDQGLALTELQNVMYTKANKSELNRALDTKANITDVSNAITEVATQLSERASIDELREYMDDKISKSELQYLLTNKVSIEEVRSLLSNKCNVHEVNQKIMGVESKMDKVLDEIKSQNKSFALQKDLAHVLVQLELKADINDVNESFNNKANKATVASALHRKANKGEVEEELKKKLDRKEMEEAIQKCKREVLAQCER